jgi:FkbM family methyltransferase
MINKSFEIVETTFGNFLINEFDLIGNFIKNYKQWEHHLFDFYSQVLKKDWVCIDAGANIGFHTIQFGKQSKQVFAFEPQLVVFNQLCSNILFNGLDEIITPHRLALGDKSDEKQMWNIEHEDWVGNGHHNWGGRGIIQDKYGGERAINNEYREHDVVKITTLDSLNITKCDLIKIDIQGYEYLAFLGAQKLLDKNKPVILLENPLSNDECDLKSKSFLLKKGYELYRYGISNKEDCILIHPKNVNYKETLEAINNIKDKYNIIQETK